MYDKNEGVDITTQVNELVGGLKIFPAEAHKTYQSMQRIWDILRQYKDDVISIGPHFGIIGPIPPWPKIGVTCSTSIDDFPSNKLWHFSSPIFPCSRAALWYAIYYGENREKEEFGYRIAREPIGIEWVSKLEPTRASPGDFRMKSDDSLHVGGLCFDKGTKVIIGQKKIEESLKRFADFSKFKSYYEPSPTRDYLWAMTAIEHSFTKQEIQQQDGQSRLDGTFYHYYPSLETKTDYFNWVYYRWKEITSKEWKEENPNDGFISASLNLFNDIIHAGSFEKVRGIKVGRKTVRISDILREIEGVRVDCNIYDAWIASRDKRSRLHDGLAQIILDSEQFKMMETERRNRESDSEMMG